jgi:hypothetical protein
MARKPTRADVVTAELVAQGERLRARRAELAAGAGLDPAATPHALEALRAQLRRGRAGLDPETIDQQRRPS